MFTEESVCGKWKQKREREEETGRETGRETDKRKVKEKQRKELKRKKRDSPNVRVLDFPHLELMAA